MSLTFVFIIWGIVALCSASILVPIYLKLRKVVACSDFSDALSESLEFIVLLACITVVVVQLNKYLDLLEFFNIS